MGYVLASFAYGGVSARHDRRPRSALMRQLCEFIECYSPTITATGRLIHTCEQLPVRPVSEPILTKCGQEAELTVPVLPLQPFV